MIDLNSIIDTDATMAANSDLRVASQKSVKTAALNWTPRLRQYATPQYLYASNGTEKDLSYNGYHLQVSPSDGDYFTFQLFCGGSETIMNLDWVKASSRGIVDLYINGILDSSGYDGYSASPTTTNSKITLSRTLNYGWNEIKFVVNGKNANSTHYFFTLWGFRLR
jgi:hypothetical protein